MINTLDMICRNVKDISPQEYIRLKAENPRSIQRAVIIPPKLGKDKRYGKMRVYLKRAFYEMAS